jgi:hypothetical protein
MVRWVLLAALLALGKAMGAHRGIAVFVGVDHGLAEERPLRYASRDAEAMAGVIRELGPFGKDDIHLLTNPTLEDFRSALKEVRGRVEELRKQGVQSLVLLYYSGHGSTEGLHVRGRNFPRTEVNALVESLASDLKILILDACESGDFLRRKGAALLPDREIVKEDGLGSRGIIVLSSSSRGEAAQESEDYRGAVFSHHLENGLRGMADYNSDGQVTLMESFEYARAATRNEEIMGQSRRQNPSFDFDIVGESDPVLTRPERRTARIVFREMPPVPLEIFNAQSQEMERRVWLTGKPRSEFSMPSGKYLLRYPEKEGYRVASLDMTWSREAAIRPVDFRSRPKTLLQSKGGKGFDLNVHGAQVSARMDLPLETPLFGIEYVYRGWPLKQILGLGYGRKSGGMPGIAVETQAFRLGYSILRPVLASRNGQIAMGAEAAWQRLRQEARDHRFGDSAIMAGGEPVRTRWVSWADIWSAGAPVEVEIFLPGRFWIGASARAEAYRYRERVSARYRTRYRVEPALILGRQF